MLLLNRSLFSLLNFLELGFLGCLFGRLGLFSLGLIIRGFSLLDLSLKLFLCLDLSILDTLLELQLILLRKNILLDCSVGESIGQGDDSVDIMEGIELIIAPKVISFVPLSLLDCDRSTFKLRCTPYVHGFSCNNSCRLVGRQ
jgi:hypothetical protein